MRAQRIGAYGGTFDPPHFGHVEIARAVVRKFHLDKLLIIPAYKPPHKTLDAISDARHRYEMATLAFAGEPRITVSRLELDAPERPYTVQTMARLREEYGLHAKLFFVMGADSFQDITKWREYGKLIESTNLIVETRPGHGVTSNHLPEAYRARVVDLGGAKDASRLIPEGDECFIYLVDDVHRDLSSTDLRRRTREGQAIEGLTPTAVAEYIGRHGLYEQDL